MIRTTRTLAAGLAVAAAVALSLTACSSGTSSASGSSSSSKGTLTIATTGNAAPFSETTKSGTLTGYDVELCTKIATNLGYKVKFVAVDFAATIPGVQSKRFDAVCSGVSLTPARLSSTDFSVTSPTIEDGVTALILKKDASKYKTIKSLGTENATMGRIQGAAEEDSIDAYLGKKPSETQYPGTTQAILDLKNGRIDAIGTGLLAAGSYAASDSSLAIIRPGITPIGDGIVLQKGSKLLTGFNAQIKKLAASGYTQSLQKKWFGIESMPTS